MMHTADSPTELNESSIRVMVVNNTRSPSINISCASCAHKFVSVHYCQVVYRSDTLGYQRR